MSSPDDAGPKAQERLQIPVGQQAIVAVPSVGGTIQHLPPGATDNLLVVSSDAPDDVAETLESMGTDLSNVGMIPVSGSPVSYEGPMVVSERIVPDDLTGLSMRYTEAIEALGSGTGWIVFDRLNVFLLYADEERVMRFLDHVAATAREEQLRSLFCVVRDAVDEQTYAKLRRRADAEIDLR